MVTKIKAALDDAQRGVSIGAFDGGRNTEDNVFNLGLNESPDELNVRFDQPNRCIGRKGWALLSNILTAKPDGHFFFFDSAFARRDILFSAGNIYDCTSGTPILKVAAAYTAGHRVAGSDLLGNFYWSDGLLAMQAYDPIAGTNAAVVPGGATSAVKFTVIITYQGSLVIGNTTYGATYEPDNIRWCNLGDPTMFLAVSAQAVSKGTGGFINALESFGIANTGVFPQQAIFVGKSKQGIFLYAGALGSLQEAQIQIAAGVLDSRAVKYVPAQTTGKAGVVFIGTDRRVWFTDGITGDKIDKKIKTELSDYILAQLAIDPNTYFSMVRNFENFQLVIDLQGQQFCYDWEQGNWTLYQGWPSGLFVEGVDSTGFPALYCAVNKIVLGTTYGFAQVNVTLLDNTTIINYYWTTGFLHAGNPQIYKVWPFLFVAFATDTGQIEYKCQQVASNKPVLLAATGILEPTSGNDTFFTWDVSDWDGGDVWAPGSSGLYAVYQRKARLAVPIDPIAGRNVIPYMTKTSLRGACVQIKLQQSQVSARFELLAAKIMWFARGYKRVL